MKNSKSNFLRISQSVQETIRSFEVLQDSGLEMEKLKVEIQETLEHLSVIAEENSASTQEINAWVEEIANASESLAALAQNLQEMIKKFKI